MEIIEIIKVDGITLYKVKFAYHVTRLTVEDDNYQNLKLTVANDTMYDGALVGLEVVFFTTTLNYQDLPTSSPYPTEKEFGSIHKRVLVPLEKFEQLDLWQVKGITPPQIRLVLAETERGKLFFGSDKQPKAEFTKLTIEENPYLVRRGSNWYSTNNSPWVNFVVIDPVDLDASCWWDTVPRSNVGPGAPIRLETANNKLWLLEHPQ